jgi:hypothetical protein
MESKLLRPLCQAVALALAAGGAHAATITVTDGGDAGTAGTCTLRQAIVSANNDSASGSSCVAGSGTDTIVFAPTLANTTINLSDAGQLLINSNVTLSGSGQTIDAQGYSRVLDVYNNSNTVASVTVSDLGLTGGSYGSPGAGLAIGSSGGLTAPTQRPKRNSPSAPTATGPNVTLNRVVINSNTATSRAGGLYINNATVAINQSSVSGNTLNASGNYGAGGIYITGGSSVTITDSTISGNTASGAFDYLTGGIYVWNSTVTVTNSTISGNTAGGRNILAGGLSIGDNTASASIYDSTVTGNTANGANVVAGGILVGTYGVPSIDLSNSILAGNTATGTAQIGPDFINHTGSNVIAQSNLLGTALSGSFTGNGNVFNDAPALGALANNGGPTLTMKPNPGSPALGAGNAALIPAGVTTDQRGVGFTRVVNGSLDLGSVEAAAGAVAAAPTPTPALSTWALGLLGGLLALLGLRKRKRANG